MMKVMVVWLLGLAIGLLLTWRSVRTNIDPVGRSLSALFGVLLSIFWPFVLACCIVMGLWCVARWPEEIEP